MRLKPFPLNPLYLVREDGKVKRVGAKRFLSPCPSKHGSYLAVSLWRNNRGRTWPIHQMVCLTYRGARPTPRHDAAHRDGDKENNHWRNINWKTRAENEADKIGHGRSNRGERNGQAKLTADKVRHIRWLIRTGQRNCEIADAFKISASHVSSIKTKRIWRNSL